MLAKALASATAAAPKTYVEDVFSTWLYTGNGSTQTITNGIDLSGKGGLVWIKSRSAATENILYDTSRGPRKYVQTQSSAAESTTGSGFGLTAFNATGFDLGFTNNDNNSSTTYASWTFRKAAKFFDVVTWAGNGASSRYISHNLGSVPGCIIVKRTDSTGNWRIYHRSLGNNAYILLNSTNSTVSGTDSWNFTDPTSTQFRINSDWDINQNGGTYVAYLFAHDAGGFGDSGNESIIKCGSYTGNSSTSGPTIDLGWEPQWVLMKNSNSPGSFWTMFDNMRGMVANGTASDDARLMPHDSSAEVVNNVLTPTSTGFQLTSSSADYNESGSTHIYIAIRRGPMKTPTDATKVFSALARTGTGTNTSIDVGFAPDFATSACRTSGEYMPVVDKLRGPTKWLTWQQLMTNAESGADPTMWFLSFTNTGVTVGPDNSGGVSVNSVNRSLIQYYFRRAPGFFDVVAYTGTGSTRTVSHNLGVTPELIIVKVRDSSNSWYVYPGPLSPASFYSLTLNGTSSVDAGTPYWSNTAATASAFTVNNSGVNESGFKYISYLFASCPGVSKVGNYTGSGTTKQIDCGFTAGARFVLIKRTDSTGDWYVWDTARGIISGNDPCLLINSSAAEVTGTDYIDPLNSGFEISSTAPAAINANGGSFIYLAIA